MRVHIPTWLKAVVALLTMLVVAVVATLRSHRAKNWFIGQFSAPHGVVGWVIAQTMAHPNKLFREVYTMAAELLDVQPDDRIHKAPPSEARADFRSATPRGFARAVMASLS